MCVCLIPKNQCHHSAVPSPQRQQFLEMSLHYHISPDFFLTVQGGFLTFADGQEEHFLSLDCREVSKFVQKLFSSRFSAEFQVQLSDTANLSRERLAFGADQTKRFGAGDLDRLLHGLIACLPFMLLGPELDTQLYVAAVRQLAIVLAEKHTVEEGEAFWKQTKFGSHPDWFLEFCKGADCDTKKLLNFIFFHCNLIKSIWQLRTLLLKKTLEVADGAKVSSSVLS